MNNLSQREREIAELVATGAANKEIARQLSLSEKTVKNVLTKVFMKTNTQCRTQLALAMVRWEGHGSMSQEEVCYYGTL